MNPATWTLLVPFVGAVLTFLIGRRTFANIVGVTACLGTLAVAARVAWDTVHGGVERTNVGGWDPPLGIALQVDGFSALMLVMTASVMTLVALYAAGHMDPPDRRGWSETVTFWPLWLFLLAGLNALFLSADLFNLYVVLELLSLCGVALVVLHGGAGALAASTRYLLAVFFGSMFYLLGVALIYATHHTLDLALVASRLDGGATDGAALVLMTVGLMIKSALLPFHSWLPRAHAMAPSPVSAALSGLVVMASFYLLVRLWTEVYAGHVTVAAGQLIGGLGALAVVWGSLQALRQVRIKLVLAYSTVAQMGYLFLLIPLAALTMPGDDWTESAAMGWSGGILQLFSHAFAKAALFLAAGLIIQTMGHDRIADLRGLARTMPMTMFTFGLAGMALVGLPPSGTFAAKWLLLQAAVASGQWWWAVVIGLGTILGAAYIARIIREAFVVDPSTEGPGSGVHPRTMDLTMKVPWRPRIVALVLALIAVLMAFFATGILQLLEVGAPFIADLGGEA